PVRGEEVELTRTARVAEEVEVSKEAVQRTERVAGTVRREEVRVQEVEGAAAPAPARKTSRRVSVHPRATSLPQLPMPFSFD
ncbi:MAG: hypothetical protein AVDCRST_MAG49-2144, partial [uncultured Thermomicrobiales bacterium]